jgi:2-keto-3-deoxy-L-rhamnonate aldolase RhmA
MDPTLHLGTWLSLGSPAAAELAAYAGMPWVLIDLEHGCASEAAVPDQLRALRGTETRGIVRVGALQPDLIARVLDWGAHGVMLPRVETAEQAQALVQAAHYAPRGTRGYSRTVATHRYGLRDLQLAPEPLLMAQIETLAGVYEVQNIAAVPDIHVLFVGPADLQQDLAHNTASTGGQVPSFKECLSLVAKTARLAGKESGILLRDPATLAQHRSLGYSHIAIDSDLSILRKAWQSIITAADSGGFT